MHNVSERLVKSNMIQTPPPEEFESLPSAGKSPTEIYAIRLANAYKRACDMRSVLLQGHEKRIETRTDREVAKVFWDLARWCIIEKIDNPEGFIAAQVAHNIPKELGDTTMGIAPNIGSYQHDVKAFERWTAYRRRIVKELQQKFDSSSLEFECQVSTAKLSFPSYDNPRLWNYVLMNKMFELSPLFRYAVAFAELLPTPMEEYREAALQQLLVDPISYVAAWGTRIPHDIKNAASKLILTSL